MVSRIAGGDRMKFTVSVLSLSFAGVLSGCSQCQHPASLYAAEIQKPYLNQQVEGEWIMANLDDSHEGATHRNHLRVSISKSRQAKFRMLSNFVARPLRATPGQYSKYDFSLVSLAQPRSRRAFAESKEKEKHIFAR